MLMAHVKDLTGDLGKLPARNLPGEGKAVPRSSAFRKTAFDPVSWFCWTLLSLFLLVQLGFLLWIA